jgi:hypothetical protein
MSDKAIEACTKENIIARLEKTHPLWEVVKPNAASYADLLLASTLKEEEIWFAVARSCGFGGSDQNALVMNYIEKPADFETTAREICSQKLLLSISVPSNEDQKRYFERGHYFEGTIAKKFLEKYSMFNIKRYMKGLEKLSTSRGPHPFMRYSPDDLVIMHEKDCPWGFKSTHPSGMVVILVDYKAPGSVTYDARGNPVVMDGYKMQLHAGKAIGEHNGLPINGMVLVQYDHSKFDVAAAVVKHEPAMTKLILEANAHYHDEYLAKGMLPPEIKSKGVLDLDELTVEDQARLAFLGRQYPLLKKAAAELDKLHKEMSDEIKLILDKLPGNQKTESAVLCGLTNISATPDIDLEKLKAVCAERGWLDQCIKEDFDKNKAMDLCAAEGIEIPLAGTSSFKLLQHKDAKALMTPEILAPVIASVKKLVEPPVSALDKLEIELGDSSPESSN